MKELLLAITRAARFALTGERVAIGPDGQPLEPTGPNRKARAAEFSKGRRALRKVLRKELKEKGLPPALQRTDKRRSRR